MEHLPHSRLTGESPEAVGRLLDPKRDREAIDELMEKDWQTDWALAGAVSLVWHQDNAVSVAGVGRYALQDCLDAHDRGDSGRGHLIFVPRHEGIRSAVLENVMRFGIEPCEGGEYRRFSDWVCEALEPQLRDQGALWTWPAWPVKGGHDDSRGYIMLTRPGRERVADILIEVGSPRKLTRAIWFELAAANLTDRRVRSELRSARAPLGAWLGVPDGVERRSLF
ncbi:hypothetical protein TK90_2677 (plasmid) [Thioalkalivibrio sp. K90mix]|uniref:hypothetical protein n=1 Tax=Thioalkalivibrio sp. (strain K90mix) TaxID=396595 RepID=UPI000195A3C2|nr:hypothetical protein [Thioalkalivibrio sp. K90mix]ADC73164.1 hypothetical protein TK90_2677 [Thioalkalivibrio sp. K90mix]